MLTEAEFVTRPESKTSISTRRYPRSLMRWCSRLPAPQSFSSFLVFLSVPLIHLYCTKSISSYLPPHLPGTSQQWVFNAAAILSSIPIVIADNTTGDFWLVAPLLVALLKYAGTPKHCAGSGRYIYTLEWEVSYKASVISPGNSPMPALETCIPVNKPSTQCSVTKG